MHQHRQNTLRTTARQLPLMTFSFSCACCGVTENRPVPKAPENWAIEHVGDVTFAFCPECAIDLPPVQQ